MELRKEYFEMRVIAGTAKSLKLKSPEGLGTRPTTDRIKETLFNMISRDVQNSVFLDLFSGSGAMGIEALSRGAKKGIFIENNKQSLKCLKDNLQHTKLETNARVISMDVLLGLKTLEGMEIADIIFLDPPYGLNLEKEVLTYLSKSSIINNDSLIIIEALTETTFDYLPELNFEIIKEKNYKGNKHVFIKIKE